MNTSEFHSAMVDLVKYLRPLIVDDYRVTEDDTPCMELTIGADVDGWLFQTGDNSFIGDAYEYQNWAVVYLYRDSDPLEVAEEIISQLAEQGVFECDK
jgi:hypothetical protein